MYFKLGFSMDNDDFSEFPEIETSMLLKAIAQQIEDGMTFDRIQDTNGNTIGKWEIEVG